MARKIKVTPTKQTNGSRMYRLGMINAKKTVGTTAVNCEDYYEAENCIEWYAENDLGSYTIITDEKGQVSRYYTYFN